MKVNTRVSMLGSLARRRQARERSEEDGFTLVELLVTMVILPFIVGALALAIIAVFQLNGSTTLRVNDAADAQILSTSFENDVHSADQVTLETSPIQCGATGMVGTQVIGLEWGSNQSGGFDTSVSYVLTTGGTGSNDQLLREYCTNGSTTPTSSTIVSADISATNPASVTFTNSSTNAACASVSNNSFSAGWVDATCVTGLTLAPSESSLSYSLLAVPAVSASSGKVSTPTSNSGCWFASPGSGTYASSLCFVDFSALVPTTAASTSQSNSNCKSGGQYMSAQIDYTPFVMSFCLLVSPGAYSSLATSGLENVCQTTTPTQANPTPYGAVCPAYMPTYYSPPSSEAYLGNNGFYTGVPQSPALYTTQNGSTVTLNFYNIQVSDANGNAATGWELATGDAESTDSGEDIIWSTCSSLPATSGTYGFQSCNGPAFSLLPDNTGGSQSNDIGNACPYSSATVTGTLFPNTWLTGLGTYSNGTISNSTNTVECAADNSSDKTGTVMLEASEPSTLTVQMHGSGLQAIFMGLVLQ